MTAAIHILRDDTARRAAISGHDRSVLVEAGAGSGKTAVMAGRIAAMLAQGTPPKSIAAVTFTELAASELLVRVRDFVSELVAGIIPTELRIAFPDGLSGPHKAHLEAAAAHIDEITCSTIHGFCQRLIKPYPVEADIDPGASVMDRNQADLAFVEIVDAWLRDRLSGAEGGLIGEMVLHSPGETVGLIHRIVDNLRKRRTVAAPVAEALAPHLAAFQAAAADFAEFIRTSAAVEEETAVFAERFAEMADGLEGGPAIDTPAGLVRLLTLPPHPDLCTKACTFLAFKKKGKWIEAAKREGLAKADGERLNLAAEAAYAACCVSWQTLMQNVASRVLADLIGDVRPVLDLFRDYKRSAALLDFDDLIFAARDLLRDHDDVRRALAARFSKVLVDEFQDTDPLQTEIFWRLCGEPPEAGATADWSRFTIRPGALFLVGDPKQAIYRFRGADVSAYVRARDAFIAQDEDSVMSISTNFRSCAPILTFVNERFEGPLSSDGQPGFTALDPFHADRGEALCIAALDVAVAGEDGKASAEQQRDAEADAVAQMCARLIGSEMILDRRSGAGRLCRPGDIALLAPTGSDLWRYEEALERYGIPVATQAGKGLFRRQEVQDLIALTRVLADRRDTLALGALLRGPLVGLTEEQLLDIIWALPRPDDTSDRLPRLDLGVDPADITHPLVRATIEKLQALYRQTNSTTPHELLSQAIDALRVRPILLARHRGQAERALANVDLYLSLTSAFAVRGLRAFAETMTAAWTDEARAVEGRPDAQEEAVALYTMHAAKGLEWPIVVPINTMTGIKAPDSVVTDRDSDTFYCPVFGVKPAGYEEVLEAEKAELDRERIRLWYVAATRARELLVLPRLDAAQSKSAWISLVDLSLGDLPALDLSHLPEDMGEAAAQAVNAQTRDGFAAEAAAILDKRQRLVWLAPSRDESQTGPVLTPEAVEIWAAGDDALPDDDKPTPSIQGGRERGLILHKLLEEVLTGETKDDEAALTDRARTLIVEIGQPVTDDPAQGLTPGELAGCVVRTLGLPEIAELRPGLVPELSVYAAVEIEGVEQATAGIADATSFDNHGKPSVVIDWKSDVQPAAETIEHYRAQVRAYLDITGAERGLIVLVTSGQVITVAPTPAAVAA
ncbi:exodeoxyribonuclease-5 [Sphingomonas laterariae]|jgi:ATP-dependent exoDNAse (exonuclease V) beta subunit|uniref:DNA 3'-5' helicase n=1 Tax=Edaphosphingomonas laterariae TaxID=861865 RepID=A0A239JQ08_9SPHN|nr:UvrD-helicase domain-containing protein [Sphingomonas laterariae]SNT07622.1 exodeoxyribonuclease-5 [Sphingomonas laterariae]